MVFKGTGYLPSALITALLKWWTLQIKGARKKHVQSFLTLDSKEIRHPASAQHTVFPRWFISKVRGAKKTSARSNHVMVSQVTNSPGLKLPGMISKPRTRCKQPSCTHTATYGYRKAEFCEAHAPADSTNLVEHKCSSCGLIEILNSGNLCGNCDPKAAAARVRLSDQKTVKAFFDSEGLVYVSYDRQVEGGNCGRERPDFLFDAGTHFVVVEVDEHQHLFSGYSCHCEQVRMANITESLQLPTVFVRYNPDTYKPASGKVVSAKQRLVDLAKVVRAQIANRPECVCGVMYLFYDQHSAEDFTNIHVVS